MGELCFDCKDGGFYCKNPPECTNYKNAQCCFSWGYLTKKEMEADEYDAPPDELPLSELCFSAAYQVHGETIKNIERKRRRLPERMDG